MLSSEKRIGKSEGSEVGWDGESGGKEIPSVKCQSGKKFIEMLMVWGFLGALILFYTVFTTRLPCLL